MKGGKIMIHYLNSIIKIRTNDYFILTLRAPLHPLGSPRFGVSFGLFTYIDQLIR